MKETGMVRKIDELGRIVIPKEIRTSLRLREGMKLELYINEMGQIVLKYFSPMNILSDFSDSFCSILYGILNKEILICDMEKVISYFGTHEKKYLGKKISKEIYDLIKMKKNYIGSKADKTTIYKVVDSDVINFECQLIFPIVVNENTFGAVIVVGFDECEITPSDIQSVSIVAKFLSEQLML